MTPIFQPDGTRTPELKPDRWTLDYLNEILSWNDSAMEVRRVEDDRGIRYEAVWYGGDGDGCPEEGLVVKTFHYHDALFSGGERFMPRAIAQDLLMLSPFYFDALKELMECDPEAATRHAFTHLSLLLATRQDFVVFETFGLEERGDTIMETSVWAEQDARNAAK